MLLKAKCANFFRNLHILCFSSAHQKSAHSHSILQLYFFILTREKMELGYLVGWIAFHLYPLVIFQEPFYLAIDKPFFDIGLYVRVNAKRYVLLVLLNQNVVKVGFNVIKQ